MINQRNKNGGGTLIWDSSDWKAGLGAQGIFSTNSLLKQTDEAGWAYLSTIDPFLNYGVLGPGRAPSATFTNSSGLGGPVIATQFINNTFLYGVDTGGKLQYIDFINKVVTSGTALGVTWPHTITGTTPIGQDCLLYRHNLSGTSTISLFYSYYISGNWNVGTIENADTSSVTFADTFMSTTPTSPLVISSGDGDDTTQKSAPHPLCIGADGILYIGSGRYLHAYDGNTPLASGNGTFSSKVLTLPQGFQIIALRKYQDQLLIAGNYYSNAGSGADGTGEALLYVWNYVDLDVTQVIPLEDPYVATLFLWKGTPTVITNGKRERNGTNKIKVVTGNSVTKIADFDGALPVQRGTLVANDVLYINSGGKVITIGDQYNPANSVNHIASASQVGLSGALVYNYTLFCLFTSGGNGSTYSVNNMNNNYDRGTAYPFAYQPQFPTGYIGKVKAVEIEFFKTLTATDSTGDLTLQLQTDFHTVQTVILTNLGAIAIPLKKRYYLSSTGGTLPTFSTIGLQAQWNGGADLPLISSVAIEYDDIVMPSNT